MYRLSANPNDNNVRGESRVFAPFCPSLWGGRGRVPPSPRPGVPDAKGVPTYARGPGLISGESIHSPRNFSQVTYVIGTATNMYFHSFLCWVELWQLLWT